MAEVITDPITTENISNPEKTEALAGEKSEREEEEFGNESLKKPMVEDNGDNESTKEKDEEMKEKESGNLISEKPKVDDGDESTKEKGEEMTEEMEEKEGESAKLGSKEGEVSTDPITTENLSNPEKIEALAGEKREREEEEGIGNETSKKLKVEDNGDNESTKEKDEEMKEKESGNQISEKLKVDDNDDGDESMKEKGEEMTEEMEEKEGESAKLGPKEFGSGEAMFNYFYKLLHHWPPNVNINKYEHMVLSDLLKKGHAEADRKIGSGIEAFQVRYHPMWKSRCFFLVRADGSSDDFSFRKCVDQILPLPENMKIPLSSNGNKKKSSDGGKHGGHHKGGGGGGGRGRGGGRGYGRKGGSRK